METIIPLAKPSDYTSGPGRAKLHNILKDEYRGDSPIIVAIRDHPAYDIINVYVCRTLEDSDDDNDAWGWGTVMGGEELKGIGFDALDVFDQAWAAMSERYPSAEYSRDALSKVRSAM